MNKLDRFMYLLDKECSSAVLNQFTKITEKIKRRLNIFFFS